MTDINSIQSQTEERMSKACESLKSKLSKIQAGRASPTLLDGITVDYYGSVMPLNQVATISVPEARLIIVQPWDKTMLEPVEKAIQKSNIGMNPQNDGNIIRLPVPSLSEDRRKELVKSCKQICEDSKVAVRNIRRDSNEIVKNSKKNKDISEDDEKNFLDKIQDLTDKYVKRVDEQFTIKEKEILEQ